MTETLLQKSSSAVSTLFTDINAGNFRSLYYIHGAEKFLVKQLTDFLLNFFLKDDDSGLNFAKFSENFNVVEISNSIMSLPVFAEKRVVLLNDFDIGKEETENFLKVFDNIPPETVVIISQKNIQPAVSKGGIKKIYDNANKEGTAFEFKTVSPDIAASFAVEKASEIGVILPREEALYLAYCVLYNLSALNSEIQKLCAYAKTENGKITKIQIDSLTAKSIEAKIFSLTDAILAKDTGKAFFIYSALKHERIEPVVILSIIGGVYTDLYRASVGTAFRVTPDTLAKDFQYPPNQAKWKPKKDIAAARSIPKSTLVNALMEISLTDFKLKSSNIPNDILIERLIGKLLIV